MNYLSIPVTAIIIATSLTFFSCTSDKDDDTPSSSSVGEGGTSSSSNGNIGGTSSSVGVGGKGCDISGYKTKQIDDQIWMLQNLNCETAGSKCYKDDPANCDKYGRLYSWMQAMNLTYCVSMTCSNEIQEKHQGVCPEGWHIPSDEEWTKLTDYVGGAEIAGEKLKASSGWSWNNVKNISGDGTDEFGFGALPGGNYYSSIYSFNGSYGYWWSTTNTNFDAYIRELSYYDTRMSRPLEDKGRFYSIRCVKDN